MRVNRLKSLADHPSTGKLFRFAFVGGASGLVYSFVTLTLIHLTTITATMASIIGYLAVLPLSFAGHKRLTFRSSGEIIPEFLRFCASFALGMAAAVVAMHVLSGKLGYAPVVSIAFAIFVVPVVTFIIMNFWVFEPEKRSNRNGH